MHQNAILQAENDGVRIVGRQECALGGRDCQGLPPLACDANENTVETAAIIAAFLDSQRHLVAQISELSHLDGCAERAGTQLSSEEHTSELQSLMRISYAVFCLKNKT